MRWTRVVSGYLLLFISILLILPSLPVNASEIYRIPIKDEVEKGLYAFLQRAFEEAEEAGADVVILDINTPGGFVDSAENIAKLMDETPLKTVAFINQNALSAGAFIALHADEIYMVPSGRIGAAKVIDGAGNAAEEKANSAWLTSMKTAAESSDRDPLYALAMADESIDLPEYRAGEGKLLTLSATEAEEVGYSEGTVASFEALLKELELNKANVTSVNETFAEKVARFVTDPIIVPILLSIASLGLVVELYSPGFGVAGTMGLTAIGLFFFGHMVAGLAGYESILLFVLGVGFIIAEFFLPGAIAGIIGAALIIGSILLAGGNVFHMGIAVLIALMVAIVGMVILMKFFGKNLKLFNKIILKDATDTEHGYVSNVNRYELIGRMAVSMTPLRPSGTIMLDGERIDAVTEGGYVDANKIVKIIKVEGSRTVVREVKEGENEA
ncbi:nodulation protein NfeD [Paenisporosarcina quisquiliarum]|uniref:Nodulation protein NfeD n=1 Tax=Paenisporosarcina quisquiliarum TaxID=365346 RepID=A0A9X3LDP4_9BACL|nr:nodulation protein NfeD [Paenisporosarcina quisquiliarum]MCZ8536075.1 nodulation protein NfeD [Paenisporosarcina quisquiliarum]